MEFIDQHLLSVITFLPLVWGLVGLCLPAGRTLKIFTLLGSLVTFALSVKLYFVYDAKGAEFQLVEQVPWIQDLGVSYFLGLDGISLWLMLLTTTLTPLVVLGSFQAIETRERFYYFLLLAMEFAMLGAFVALDVFLFYVFWEAMLIPMYFLIGIWGGKDRIYAAMKFFLFTVVGSLLMLVAIFYLAYQHKLQFGSFSTSVIELYKVQIPGGDWFSPQSLLFLAFALAFAIKVPLFPLHTWLPDAHVQAPTAGSVILAGVLLKMGGYGFLRFAFPLFPNAVHLYQTPFLILSAIAIIYGACVAMMQPDIKKLVAYSSVSHMGYVVLGLFAMNMLGTTGAIYQMLNHGVSTGALFLLVGMVYERKHTRDIAEYGGIAKVMPVFTTVFLIVTLSSVALPGTNGFVGEFLILLGTWEAKKWAAVLSGLGVILGAVYMLWMFQRVMFGPLKEKNKSLIDLQPREVLIMIPILFLIIFMGVRPNFFFTKMEPSIQRFVERTQRGALTDETKVETAQSQYEAVKGMVSWNR